jgi:hypothetical protein
MVPLKVATVDRHCFITALESAGEDAVHRFVSSDIRVSFMKRFPHVGGAAISRTVFVDGENIWWYP